MIVNVKSPDGFEHRVEFFKGQAHGHENICGDRQWLRTFVPVLQKYPGGKQAGPDGYYSWEREEE